MKMGKIRMWLRIKLFVIFSVLMVLCVTTVSITIVKMTTNLYMKEVEATGKRDLMLITSSLESTLQRISNTAVSIVSDSRIIGSYMLSDNSCTYTFKEDGSGYLQLTGGSQYGRDLLSRNLWTASRDRRSSSHQRITPGRVF